MKKLKVTQKQADKYIQNYLEPAIVKMRVLQKSLLQKSLIYQYQEILIQANKYKKLMPIIKEYRRYEKQLDQINEEEMVK